MNNVSYAYGFHEPVLNHLDLELVIHSLYLEIMVQVNLH